MFAIIRTGGKQYKVSEGDRLEVEKLDVQEGEKVVFDEVLAVYDDKEMKTGKPLLEKAKVEGKLIAQKRGDKVITIKQKPKKRYLKKQGHRQDISEVEISRINLSA
ncbi:MAG: 50S ribosomal protein L21 [Candidatus Moranbacteria bacterium]|nr:50S ribosomal protein L21 [Candidatus Moranbacteria bacterium]